MALASASCRASRDGFLRGARSVASTSSPVPETMSYLRDLRTGNEVFLVGTAHISRKSAEEVRSVIKSVKPDTVFLELCAARAAAMRSSTSRGSDEGIPEPVRQLLASFGCVRPPPAPGGAHSRPERFLPPPCPRTQPYPPSPPFPSPPRSAPGDMGEKLLGAGLRAIYQMLRQFHGLDPGLEFKVGMEEADRSGARLVLGDRDQDATVRALREALDFSEILRLISGSNRGGNGYEWMDPELARRFASADWSDPERAVELLKTRRATSALTRQMRAQFPRVAAAMLDERDDIMTRRLLRECPGRTVAVVGMAHMDGIEERWRAAQGGDGGVTLISGS